MKEQITPDEVPAHVLARLSGVEDRLDKVCGELDEIGGRLMRIHALAERTAVRVARLDHEREIPLDKLDEMRKSIERISSKPTPAPTSATPPHVRAQLESLSDEIEDTKAKLVLADLQRRHDQEKADLQAKLYAAQSANSTSIERWKIVAGIVTVVLGLVAAVLSGRASAPVTPSIPYAVPVHT